ncbi:hypothetical protein ACVWZX_005401, partial [Deinococcus sp. UYEF24]
MFTQLYADPVMGASQNFGVSKNKGMNGEDQAQLAFDTLMAEV